MQRLSRTAWVGVATTLLITGCGIGVNRTFDLADGESRSGGLVTVNGSVTIGSECRVGGNCRTVNGRIEVGDASEVKGLQTVNGRVEVGARAVVDGDIATVNGRVEIGAKTLVAGDVATVNGDVDLVGGEVRGSLTLANGDVLLDQGARVQRNVEIERGDSSRVNIVIRGGSVIAGDVRASGPDGRVVIHLVDGSIEGRVRGATVVEGDAPKE